jgi:uncharacterized membrane protein YbaN (DUF454 family)
MTSEAGAPTLSTPARWLLQALAGVCVLLGVIGIFVPVMPSVPFLVVAGWAASRSSPRMHRWLMAHPRFGHLLRDWYEAGVVPRRAKWITTVMVSCSAIMMLVITPAAWLAGAFALIACMAAVVWWLWRRPERRPE